MTVLKTNYPLSFYLRFESLIPTKFFALTKTLNLKRYYPRTTPPFNNLKNKVHAPRPKDHTGKRLREKQKQPVSAPEQKDKEMPLEAFTFRDPDKAAPRRHLDVDAAPEKTKVLKNRAFTKEELQKFPNNVIEPKEVKNPFNNNPLTNKPWNDRNPMLEHVVIGQREPNSGLVYLASHFTSKPQFKDSNGVIRDSTYISENSYDEGVRMHVVEYKSKVYTVPENDLMEHVKGTERVKQLSNGHNKDCNTFAVVKQRMISHIDDKKAEEQRIDDEHKAKLAREKEDFEKKGKSSKFRRIRKSKGPNDNNNEEDDFD